MLPDSGEGRGLRSGQRRCRERFDEVPPSAKLDRPSACECAPPPAWLPTLSFGPDAGADGNHQVLDPQWELPQLHVPELVLHENQKQAVEAVLRDLVHRVRGVVQHLRDDGADAILRLGDGDRAAIWMSGYAFFRATEVALARAGGPSRRHPFLRGGAPERACRTSSSARLPGVQRVLDDEDPVLVHEPIPYERECWLLSHTY